MGKNNRKQPVTFNVPSSTDYRFTNINNFRGVNISENPLQLSPESASDMLNLYVDDSGTLTTRPRLELDTDITPIFGDALNKSLIKVFETSKGTLFLVYRGNASSELVFKYLDNNVQKVITVAPPQGMGVTGNSSSNFFEKNGKVFILNCLTRNSQKTIGVFDLETRVLSDILSQDIYIPTTKLGNTGDLNSGVDFEEKNILTSKYRKSFVWGNDFNFKLPPNSKIVQNTIFNPTALITRQHNTQRFSVLSVNPNGVLYTGVGTKEFLNLQCLIYYSFDGSLYSGEIYPTHSTGNDKVLATACAGSLKHKIYVCYGNLVTNQSNLYVFRVNANSNEQVKTYSNCTLNGIASPIPNFSRLYVSDDEKSFIALSISDYKSIYFGTINESSLTIRNAIILPISMNNRLLAVTPDCDSIVACGEDSLYYYSGLLSNNISQKTISIPGLGYCSVSEDCKAVCYNDGSTTTKVILNIETENPKKINLNSYLFKHSIYYKDKQIWGFEKANELIIYSNLTTIPVRSTFIVNTPLITPEGIEIPQLCASENQLTLSMRNYEAPHKIFFQQFKLDIFGELVLEFDDFDNSKLLNQLLKSSLDTRFNNELWLASENTTFYSSKNNPFYFTESSYNEYGDVNFPITGFNILGDNLMAIYKSDKVHLVSTNDTYKYTYTETKTLKGNIALGQTNVTPLTEIPIHIGDDGVYGLQLTENIQSSDRSSVLLSKSINSMFTKEILKNCKICNNSYWTYIFTPTNNALNPSTNLYILDNRTNEWFIWNVPCYVQQAYIFNGLLKVADSQGYIYRFVNTDIVQDYNAELREYYDLDRKLIPWRWRSQILHLGTINYRKQLLETGFIFTDTDQNDSYGINYKFKVFRQMASETGETTLENKLNYIRSVTKKSNIPKFNFIQMELYNTEELDHNKLNLIGLSFKYRVLP